MEQQPSFVDEGRLLRAVGGYLRAEDVAAVERVLAYTHELGARLAAPAAERSAQTSGDSPRGEWDTRYALSVAQTMADATHIDAVSLAAVLLNQAVQRGLTTPEQAQERLGGEFGASVAATIRHIEAFDRIQSRGAERRRETLTHGHDEGPSRERRRGRERQREQDADSLRRMFLAMAEDPRVAVFKIADQLRLIRRVREDAERSRAAERAQTDGDGSEPGAGEPSAALWTVEERATIAEESRDIFAPLASRLGMGRVAGELQDLAFAVLEPEEYRWLFEAVREETSERENYVERVCAILREEMRSIGLRAEVSGRIKNLYSIYKKVQRSGDRDLSHLFDILAFRIILTPVEGKDEQAANADCYLALGHVHALWRPKDGRIKDFIANPKANGYQSLHTTVFCLDERLAEIQIRTRAMHQVAEYGVAMHWYYKREGDEASGEARDLRRWMQQVREWQQELQTASGSLPAVSDEEAGPPPVDAGQEAIFVFTPAGDVKDMMPTATALDFAYRVHTDLGNHVSGVRVASSDANGRLIKKLVPLDYTLKNGDVVEIMTRKDAHPTRDWLNVARTKLARSHIQRYLKKHDRDIDIGIGRERLDRELRGLGLRKGIEDLADEDLDWLVELTEQPDAETFFAALGAGSDRVRVSLFMPRLKARLFPAAAATPASAVAAPAPVSQPAPAIQRESESGASVEGMAGMLTRLANCCDPMPGDEVMGYISRGRGVIIHRADCPNLLRLLDHQPERGIHVDLPKEEGRQVYRAPIVVHAEDRPGLLADVTGVITKHNINMFSVGTATNMARRRATITATLELERRDQFDTVVRALYQVPSVLSVERQGERKRPVATQGERRKTS